MSNQANLAVVTDPDDYNTTHEEALEKAAGRKRLLPWILGGYLSILTASIVIPIFVVPHVATGADVEQIQNLMAAISGVAQGLFGILGVMVGYYFRQATEAP